jgi:hypothetical protein
MLIPHLKQYAHIPTCRWNYACAPRDPMTNPDGALVSAYIPLLYGSLVIAPESSTHHTYYFATDWDPGRRDGKSWARVVKYKFRVDDELQIMRARFVDRPDSALPTLRFSPATGDELTIWIGNAEFGDDDRHSRSDTRHDATDNATDRTSASHAKASAQAPATDKRTLEQTKEDGILKTIMLDEPSSPDRARHFVNFYRTQCDWKTLPKYIPHPDDDSPIRSTHTGYCGPDTQP